MKKLTPNTMMTMTRRYFDSYVGEYKVNNFKVIFAIKNIPPNVNLFESLQAKYMSVIYHPGKDFLIIVSNVTPTAFKNWCSVNPDLVQCEYFTPDRVYSRRDFNHKLHDIKQNKITQIKKQSHNAPKRTITLEKFQLAVDTYGYDVFKLADVFDCTQPNIKYWMKKLKKHVDSTELV